MQTMHRVDVVGLVDIVAELDTLGLELEYDEPAGFIVCCVQDGSAAAQCGRVNLGDVATEFNSVAIQRLQRAPAVRKHGIRPGKFAFLRVRKADGSFVECAIERSNSTPAQLVSQHTAKQFIESKASAQSGMPIAKLLPNGIEKDMKGELASYYTDCCCFYYFVRNSLLA